MPLGVVHVHLAAERVHAEGGARGLIAQGVVLAAIKHWLGLFPDAPAGVSLENLRSTPLRDLVDIFRRAPTRSTRELFGTKKNGRVAVDDVRASSGATWTRSAAGSRRSASSGGTTSPSSRTTASSGRSSRTRLTASARPGADVRAAARQGLGVHPRATARRRSSSSRPTSHPRQDRGYLKTIPSLKHIVAWRRRQRQRRRGHRRRTRRSSTSGKTRRPPSSRRRTTRLPHLHERHDRQPQGRHPLALQHRVERQRGARGLSAGGPTTARFRFSRGRTPSGRRASSTASSRAARAWRSAEAIEKIIDNLAEVRPTLLFSVPRIFNKLYTAVQKQIAEQARRRAERSSKPALEIARRSSATTSGSRSASTRPCRSRTSSSSRRCAQRFGGRLKYAVQRRRGHLARRRRVHRQPRHRRLRGLRPHRDVAHRDGQLARRAQDRERRPRHPRRAHRDRLRRSATRRRARPRRRRGRSSSTART